MQSKSKALIPDQELARMDEAERWLRETYGHKCEVFRAATRIIDVHAKGVSKNRSARELQQRLGKKWLVCVGDAHNDIPMLERSAIPFAPANCAQEVKDWGARLVCPCWMAPVVTSISTPSTAPRVFVLSWLPSRSISLIWIS